MTTRALILAALALASAAVPSQALAGLEVCARNQFARVGIRDVAAFGGGGLAYYCDDSTEQPPAAIEALLDRLGLAHGRVAALFGTSPDDLFAPGVNLNIFGDPFGSFASEAGGNEVDFGVSSQWNGGPLDDAIYFHELGHVVAASKSAAVPSDLLLLSDTKLLQESFPDALAYGMTGHVLAESEDVPGCMKYTRVVTDFQSYTGARSYFTEDFTFRRLSACCNYLRKKGQLGEAKPRCDELDAVLARKPLTPFDPTPLDPDRDWAGLEAHQLGIPLNSFLTDLASRTGRELLPMYLDAFRKAGSLSYDCSLKSAASGEFQATVAFPTMETVLGAIRAAMSAAEQGIYDDLWTKHAMDVGVRIAKREASELARKVAVSSFKSRLKTDDVCILKIETASFDDPACQLTCVGASQ